MFIANDRNGIRVDIMNADLDGEYFCPICGQELNQRRGEKNLHHFAHKRNSHEMCDSWHYDMSEWHRNWQMLFPEECREVVVEHNGKKHRADVLINNTVIEFQHSKFPCCEEFFERNNFYTTAGYNLIWLFDMVDEYKERRISLHPWQEFIYDWNYHWKIFNKFDPELNRNIYVCFQLGEDLSEGNCGIEHLQWMSDDKKTFGTEHGVAFDKEEFIQFVRDYVYEEEKEASETITEDMVEPRTILEILLNSNGKVIFVKNIKTGIRAKIGNNQEYFRTHVIYNIKGYLGRNDGPGYYNDRRDIYYWNKPEWVLSWEI